MKKLMTLMIGMTLAFAIVAPTFAQDTTKKTSTKTKTTKTKAPKKTPTKA
jgi:hypothetical protein